MGTSASFARKASHCLAAALLTLALVPASAFAQGEATQPQDAVDSQAGELQEVESEQVDAGSGSAPAASPAESGTLASALIGTPTAFINSDVALDGEPVIGSFTVDGLTFAVTEGSDVELVGVSSDRQQVTSPQEGGSSPVVPMLASGPVGTTFAVPESIAYDGVDYAVASIGAYAFYLSGVTSVELPASVADVDDRAFRSSDVASVTVANGNPTYSSFDGALYDADQSSLLLIPEGKQGTVLLPKRAEVADAGKFSHCSLASAIAVEEGSAAFASENGLLYDASLTTLLRVPAGAADITIRDGCTTIAAGAMEACASLAIITAPASVTSISPDVFTSVPTVSLPVASVADNGIEDEAGAAPRRVVASSQGLEAPLALPDLGSAPASSSAEASGSASSQITAMVALSSADDDLLEVDPAAIMVAPTDASETWLRAGFEVGPYEQDSVNEFELSSAATYAANQYLYACAPGVMYFSGNWFPTTSSTDLGIHSFVYIGAHVRHLYRFADGSLWFTANLTNTEIARLGLNTSCTGVTSAEYTTDFITYYPLGSSWTSLGDITYIALNGARDRYAVVLDSQGADIVGTEQIVPVNKQPMPPITVPQRNGYAFEGYWSQPDGRGECFYAADGSSARDAWFTEASTLFAKWRPLTFDVSFDTSSEPGDEDYPGIEKPDEIVNVDDGPTVIEDPKRPGYVFQGWVIPNTDGTEAIDQDLVYKDESDGKWYVDASKLPDYANDEGRVELTARWTSVISVDVPSAVTFYADVVTQGNESREGAASSAFGQNKVASQSEVDLRIVGLESKAVTTQGSTLGADSILKKASSATPSSSTQKLFSLYPTDKALTPDDLQDPDAVSATKPSDAVDFALDDLLLEKSFAADSFTIPAGDTLNLGYRLNLSETGTKLDYDTLSTLDEGTSASIANISYCFAAEGLVPTGSKSDPFWVENANPEWGTVGVYGLDDIKNAANALSALVDGGTDPNDEGAIAAQAASSTYALYRALLDSGTPFHLKVDGRYLDVQLIGICQDAKADGTGKAGLTFQMKDVYAYGNKRSTAAGGGAFASAMNSDYSGSGTRGWAATPLREALRTSFAGALDPAVREQVVAVDKGQQLSGGSDASFLQLSAGDDGETVWLPSMYEVFGSVFESYNRAEQHGVGAYVPFQYSFYAGNGGATINPAAIKTYNGSAVIWWLRSAYEGHDGNFCNVYPNGERYGNFAHNTYGVAPAFCL